MQVYDSLIEMFGNTPLVRLRRVALPSQADVLAKVEYFNPGGSVKDRIALRMVEAAEASGALQPGGTIVEPTSGNTGIGLAIVAQEKGYKCLFVCPDKVSQDKISVLRAYGADVVVCPSSVPPDHPDSYYSVSDRLAAQTEGGWKPNQYTNPDNPSSHYQTTGPEIWEQTQGKATHFVAGIGTGGTISGTGRYLKEVSGGRVRIVGADPEGSVYSGGGHVDPAGGCSWDRHRLTVIAARCGPAPPLSTSPSAAARPRTSCSDSTADRRSAPRVPRARSGCGGSCRARPPPGSRPCRSPGR